MLVEEIESKSPSVTFQQVTSSDPVALEHQESDSKKVHPWFGPDVMVEHPDANTNPQDTIQEESLQATTASSSTQPAKESGSFLNWLWGLIFPSSKSKQSSQKTDQMIGDMPIKEYQNFISEMRRMLARIKEFNDELNDELAFEKLLAQVYKNQIAEREDERIDHFDEMKTTLRDKQHLNKERLEKLDILMNKESSYKWWGRFTTAATVLGIGAVGTTISGGAALAGFLVAVGLSADALMEDWVKKKLVDSVTDDSEKAEKYTQALQLGCAVASMAIFISLGAVADANISGGLQVANNVAQGSSTAGQGYSRYSTNCSQADMREVSHKAEIESEKLKRETEKIKSLVTTVHDYYRNLSTIERSKLEAAMQISRA